MLTNGPVVLNRRNGGIARRRAAHEPRLRPDPRVLAIVIACWRAGAAVAQSQAPAAAATSVVVTAERLSVETLIDRKVYKVAADVQSTFGTVSDVLSAIPSVDVDSDGVVSLRGDTSVLILIDGRPSAQLAGATAGENLQSIPARDIERIEVITTPPAEFKADGAAGVINIITRKKPPDGLSALVQGSLGSAGRSVLGASGSYRSGPLTAAASAGYRQDYRSRLLRSEVLAPDPTTAQLLDSRSSIDERIRRAVPTVGLSAEYALSDQRSSVSASMSWADRGGLRTYTQRNDSNAAPGVLTSSAQRLSAGHDPEIDYDEKLGFSHQFGRPGEALDLSLHRSTSRQREHYDYTNDSFVPPTATLYSDLGFQEDRVTSEFGADYALPLAQTRSLKIGYAFEQDDYQYRAAGHNVDPVTGRATVDTSISNDFRFLQQISAGYASYQASIGTWNWLGGLRAEMTRTDARLLIDHAANSRSYLSIHPSLHVERSLSGESKLSFGASRRVARPSPDNLNPYVDREYTPNLRGGNPDLRPQYTQSYEVGYERGGHGLAYGLTGYYRRNRNSVTDVTEYLGNGLSLTTKANLPRNDAAGLEFNVNGPIVPKLACSLSGNLFYNQIDATALGAPGLQSTTGLNAKGKLDYHPTFAATAQLTVTRSGKRLTPQGYVSAINIVNLGYRHQVQAGLTAIMTVSDAFNGQRFRRLATTPTFMEEYQRTVRGRILYAGLVYSFGSSKKDKQANFEYDP